MAHGDNASLDKVEPARMSRTNRNFAFAYTFLVILPLVGLAGILKTGRSLTAPVSIDGIWNLHVDSAQLNSLPCGQTLAAIPDQAISISQSGRSFVLSLPGGPKVIGSGTLDGTTLHASLTPPPKSSGSGCDGGYQLSLLATVDRQADSRSLAGTLSVTNCPTCASVGFQAERQSPAMRKGGQ
jgi:hypothetical protein